MRPYTDPSLGYCSSVIPQPPDCAEDDRYLNLCYGEPMFAKNPSLGESTGPRPGAKECRYVLRSRSRDLTTVLTCDRYLHFQVSPTMVSHVERPLGQVRVPKVLADRLVPSPDGYEPPRVAQWVNCDIRSFDYSVLGQ